MAKIQEKWRESLVNLENIPFKNIKFFKIISYPAAGNDVFECIGNCQGMIIYFIVKSERGDFSNFSNEVKILDEIKNSFSVPKVIESGVFNHHVYIVLSKIEGEKLSDIFKENKNVNKKKYLYLYGRELAKIHNFKIKWEKAKIRVINDIPNSKTYKNFTPWELKVIRFLQKNKPKKILYNTFIHGDFHYGNILWKDYKITGILDWEYAGIGFKEQDIAWALILRPGQEFMDIEDDWKIFLDGYKSIGSYNEKYLNWCLINGMLHFYLMNQNKDNEYLQKLQGNIQILLNTK